MAGRKTSVSKINEIERLLGLNISERTISKALNVSRNTVAEVRVCKDNAQKSISESEENNVINNLPSKWQEDIDWERIREEHQSGIHLFTLWEELIENKRLDVKYNGFWKQFKKRFPNLKQSMHRVFAPGSRVEIDYCDGIPFYNPSTGEIIETELFMGVLCHSRYAFAEFTLTQKSSDFLSSHIRMFEYFGGVPEIVSPDNLRSAVSKVHRYDPDINPAYTRLAEHYGFGVLPARVRTPKDKAIVERTIQIFQRWFYQRVRHRTFTSLVELNACLREHMEKFHAKVHRIFHKTRAEMFHAEKSHLNALPANRYEVAIHTTATVHPDCHIVFEKNYYSVPYRLRGNIVDLWATDKTVEISFMGERVAFHNRIQSAKGTFQTDKNHYPEAHKAYLETIPSTLMDIAIQIGPETHALIKSLFTSATPLRHLRRAQGIVRLGKIYSHTELEMSCRLANKMHINTYRFVENQLKKINSFKPSLNNTAVNRGENRFLRGEELFN